MPLWPMDLPMIFQLRDTNVMSDHAPLILARQKLKIYFLKEISIYPDSATMLTDGMSHFFETSKVSIFGLIQMKINSK